MDTKQDGISLDEHTRRVVCRSKAFYAAKDPGHFLVSVSFPVEAPPIPPLYNFDLDKQLAEWLDHKLANLRPGWEAKKGLDDDALPAIFPRFGVAEHSAWLGMEVRLQEDTSLPVPLIKTPDDVDRIRLSDQNTWYRYVKDSYEYLRGRKDGTFFLAVRGTMSPMDLANAVRGNQLFEDFLLQPDFAHQLMRRMTEAQRWYYPQLASWADEIEGGNYLGFQGWMGPGCIGHLSNDAAMLCSSQIYNEFGFPYEKEMVAGYSHVLYHVHNEKMHYIPQLSKLPGLALLEVTQDPKMPSILEELPRVFAATGSTALALSTNSRQVRQHIEELKQRNCYLMIACRDRKDAEETVKFVRRHSKPLE